MSGRRRATLSPSLFPFLAVLVCTMGMLILLLALVSQKADKAVQQIAASQTQVDPAVLVAEQQWRLQQLSLIRQEQTNELEKRRSELAHVEDHLRRLRSQLQQLQAETVAAAHPEELDVDRQTQLDALRTEIASESQRVAELRQQAPQKRPRVVIVPHKGPNGTDRRPVYVECTSDGIFLRPENAHIAILQLDGPLGPGNPLDAALRAVRNYWQQHDPGAPPPYPLLIVRPDGIDAYAIARAAMADWDDQFGYELVSADVDLAFPKPQADLKRQVDLAIRQAVVRQHAQMAGQPRRYRPSAPLPTLSAAELARRGSAAAAGNGLGSTAANASDRSAAVRGAAHDAVASGSAGGGLAGGGLAGGGTAIGHGGSDPASGGGLAGQAVRDFDDALRDTAAAIAADGRPLGLTGGGPDLGDPLGELQRNAVGTPEGMEGASAGVAGRPAAPGSGSTAAAHSLSDRGDPTGTTATDGTSGTGATAAARPARTADTTEAATGTAEGNASSGISRQTAPGNGGSLAAGSGQPTEPTQSPGGAGGQQAGQTQPADSAQSRAVDQPTLRRDRANWALPDEVASARGAAIVRSIQVDCRADAFVLHGENARQAPQTFSIENGMVDRAAMQLAAAVQQRVGSWGLALPGGRWQPVLAVDVADEARFRQLRTLLTGSGLTLEQR